MGEKRGKVEGNFNMRRRIRRLRGFRPWQRHSLILTVAGVLYIIVGIMYIASARTDGDSARERGLKVILQYAPLEFWGGVFVFAGLLAMASSRWPPFAERWGYMVLTGLSTCWSLTYLTGILFFHSPSVYGTQVFLWGCLAFMWWAISGLLNPDRTGIVKNAGV
jgi:hypothetical protein